VVSTTAELEGGIDIGAEPTVGLGRAGTAAMGANGSTGWVAVTGFDSDLLGGGGGGAMSESKSGTFLDAGSEMPRASCCLCGSAGKFRGGRGGGGASSAGKTSSVTDGGLDRGGICGGTGGVTNWGWSLTTGSGGARFSSSASTVEESADSGTSGCTSA